MTVGRWSTTEKTRGNGSPSGSLGWATAPPTARDPTNPTFTQESATTSTGSTTGQRR